MAERTELAREIQAAFAKGLRVFSVPGSTRDRKFRTLAEQVERVWPVAWSVGLPTEALLSAIALAIAQLDQSTRPGSVDLSWRQLAMIAGGFVDPDPNTNSFTARLAYARSNRPLTVDVDGLPLERPPVGTPYSGVQRLRKDRTFRTDRDQLWEMLADALLHLEPQQYKRPQLATEPNQVVRKELEGDVAAALRRHSPVVLWGESGNGKSYLAGQLMHHYPIERTALLREGGVANSAFAGDLSAAIVQAGARPVDLMSDRMQQLRELLSEVGAFDLVVFDNVPEQTLRYVINRPAVPVLIIASTPLDFTHGTNIRIPEFSPEEALDAAHARLPTHDRKVLGALCDRLGNRPIVIDLACRLVADQEVAVEEIMASVRRDPVAALSGVYDLSAQRLSESGHRIGVSIVKVYMTLAAQLRSNPGAMAVLDTLLWITGPTFADRCLALSIDEDRGLDSLTVKAGLETLRRHGIVNRDDPELLLINHLTRDALRRLLADRASAVTERMWRWCSDRNASPFCRQETDDPHEVTYLYLDEGDDELNVNDDPDIEHNIENLDELRSIEMDLFAGDLERTRLALWQLNPVEDRGAFPIGVNIYLLWQRQTSFFADGGPSFQTALLTSEETGSWTLWTADNMPNVVSASVRQQVHCLLVAWRSAQIHQQLIHPLVEPMPRALDWWESTETAIQHQVASVAATDVTRLAGLPMWAACGRLVRPTSTELVGETENCPECEKAYSASSFFRFDVQALNSLLRRGAADAEIEFRVNTATLALARTPADFRYVAELALNGLWGDELPADERASVCRAWVLYQIGVGATRFNDVKMAEFVLDELRTLFLVDRLEPHLHARDKSVIMDEIADAYDAVEYTELAKTARASASRFRTIANCRASFAEFGHSPRLDSQDRRKLNLLMAYFEYATGIGAWRSSRLRFVLCWNRAGGGFYRLFGRRSLARYLKDAQLPTAVQPTAGGRAMITRVRVSDSSKV